MDHNLSEKELVSVIVPIYNCEKYLNECLSSIQRQNYPVLEILMIDDGSTDRSREVCQEYIKGDKRFKYFYQNNSGVSTARNLGLSLCSGGYILFCDSDDWMDSDMIERLLGAALEFNADYVISDYTRETASGAAIVTNSLKGGFYDCCQYQKILRESLTADYCEYPVHSSNWRILFKNSIIIKNNINYISITNGEDFMFGAEYALKATSAVYLKGWAPYHYRDISGSASKNGSQKLINSAEILIDRLQYILESTTLPYKKEQLDMCRFRILSQIYAALIKEINTLNDVYCKFSEIRQKKPELIMENKVINYELKLGQKLLYFMFLNWDKKNLILLYLMLMKAVKKI